MPHTDPECQTPSAFVNFLIKAFRRQDQCLYRVFSLFEASWGVQSYQTVVTDFSIHFEEKSSRTHPSYEIF